MKAWLSLALLMPAALSAQDRMHPRWELPGFDFSKDGVWRAKVRRVMETRAALLARGDFRGLNAGAALGAAALTATAVTGTIQVPVILMGFQDTPAGDMRASAQYDALLFGTTPPGGNPYTLRTFYEQLSTVAPSTTPRFSMQGQSFGWVVLASNEVNYTGTPGTCSGNPFGGSTCNGVFSDKATMQMQTGMRQALAALDAAVNFGQFDNDGLDDVANSGDDDGYVDMIAFVHPTQDGACGPANSNNHIWSHRFVLVDTNTAGQIQFLKDYVTNDPWTGHAGQFIKIRDYFATSGLGGGATGCDQTQIMPIGTPAHEFGHGLGLPDLYDTQGPTEGIGQWGLMSSGNYTKPYSPSRMEAWSLSELGWITLAPITASGTYTFGAAPISDSVFVLRPLGPPGSNPRGEYFLFENRQASLADTALIRVHCAASGNPAGCGGGLAIWHVDSQQVVNHGFRQDNAINVGSVSIHGVALQEADGLRQLWCGGNGCNRGDAGDLFPGWAANHTVFAFNTTPAATKNLDGSDVGWGISQIQQLVSGGAMSFTVTFQTAVTIISGATRPNGVLGFSYSDALQATGGIGSYTWSLTGGALPAGVTLASSGVVSGIPQVRGSFSYTARATSGAQQQSQTFSFSVGSPALTTADVAGQLINGTGPLSADQLRFLDYLGNKNGGYDVGDFKAWVDDTGAPLSAALRALLGLEVRP